MHETAYAKINLALHVRGREPGGSYHLIDTVFAFAEDGDRLSVDEGDGITLDVVGPFADRLAGHDNIVTTAALRLRDRYGVSSGAALTLDKRLPVAAGIGGGSADAAAALRLLRRWWKLSADLAELEDLARPLGADVPACVYSRTASATGRGDRLVPGGYSLTGAPVLLVNPGVPLSTRDVFERWNGRDGGPVDQNLKSARNDLEPLAAELVPEIGEVLSRLGQGGSTEMVRMSGSGATCFALYRDERGRDSAGRRIAASHPHWWQLASRLR